jgi:hypothetical protein
VIKKGRADGVAANLTRLFGLRLGRSLAPAERALVAERLVRLGEDRLDAVVLDLARDALAAWLADPEAR